MESNDDLDEIVQQRTELDKAFPRRERNEEKESGQLHGDCMPVTFRFW